MNIKFKPQYTVQAVIPKAFQSETPQFVLPLRILK